MRIVATVLRRIPKMGLERGRFICIFVLIIFFTPVLLVADSPQEADQLVEEGTALYYSGQYQEALKLFLQARKIDESLGTDRLSNLADDIGWIGECQRLLGLFDQAIVSFNEARNLFEDLQDPFNASVYNGFRGLVYFSQGKLVKSLDEFVIALEVAEEYDRMDYAPTWAANALDVYLHLGNDYYSHGNFDDAVLLYRDAAEIAVRYESWGMAFQFYSYIASVRTAQFDFEAAEEAARSAYTMAQVMDDIGAIRNAVLNLGAIYRKMDRYSSAVQYFLLAYEYSTQLDDVFWAGASLNNVGEAYNAWGKYDEALEYFIRAYDVSLPLENIAETASQLNNIGSIYQKKGDYGSALDHYHEALSLVGPTGDLERIASFYNNIASVHELWGEFDIAADYYQKTLDIAEKLDWPEGQASALSNLGLVYLYWGNFDAAFYNLSRSLEMARSMNSPAQELRYLSNLGIFHQRQQQYKKAAEYFEHALEISRYVGNEAETALLLNNLGTVYHSRGELDTAIDYYDEAYQTSVRLELPEEQISYLNNLGKATGEQQDYESSLEFYMMALELAERINFADALVTIYNNIGAAHYYTERFNEAEPWFEKAIELVEKLRATAPGAAKRDYLNYQIYNYKWLVETFYQTKEIFKAFDTLEESGGLFLEEQLRRDLPEEYGDFIGSRDYNDTLEKNELIVAFSNSSWPSPLRFTLSKSHVQGAQLDKKAFVNDVKAKYGRNLRRARLEDSGLSGLITKDTDFDAIIFYYRSLLSRSFLSRRDQQAMDYIGRRLYDYLFGSIDQMVDGIEHITVIPDGVLALVPVEALLMPDGRYLVEKYSISYSYSVSVLDMLKRRRESFSSQMHDPSPLGTVLAVGGALYEAVDAAQLSNNDNLHDSSRSVSANSSEELSPELLVRIKERILNSFSEESKNQNLRETYRSLGIGEWVDLPGTALEVKAIHELVQDTTILQGTDASEDMVKTLSASGELKQFDTIHFAVHGVVVPEVPDLSAVVLSLHSDGATKNDGYLSVAEIAELELNASFVNLSACETGLGRIYGGEGVVGLTQAFLVSGADSLSVSLWQVSDESTGRFMKGMYEKVVKQGLSYLEASVAMKREFIEQNESSRPFYWAPFVYYGLR